MIMKMALSSFDRGSAVLRDKPGKRLPCSYEQTFAG